MTRRSRNEGSIQKDGNRWVAVFELPQTIDGKRRRRKKYAKTEATRQLRLMRTEYQNNGTLPNNQRKMTETLEDFMTFRKSLDLVRSTHDRETWMLQIIADGLGHKRTATLTVADCDQFLAKAAAGLTKANGTKRKPIGKPQLKRVRNKLIAALRNDIRIGITNRNVADLSVLPANAKPKPQRRSLTRTQLADLCAATTGATGILIDFSGRNGLRPAEARAMTWNNINFNEQTMAITHQLNRNDEHVAPKTKRAGRIIRIDQTTLTKLKTWRTTQEEQRTYAGPVWQERNIIATTASGTPIQRNNYARSMRQLCKQLNIKPHVTPYELRHTAISLQAETGQTPWNIADWAGTSEKMICDTYRHKLQEVVPVRLSQYRTLLLATHRR